MAITLSNSSTLQIKTMMWVCPFISVANFYAIVIYLLTISQKQIHFSLFPIRVCNTDTENQYWVQYRTPVRYWDSGNTDISKPKIWEILSKNSPQNIILDPIFNHWYFMIMNYISNRPKMQSLIAGSCPKLGLINDWFHDLL